MEEQNTQPTYNAPVPEFTPTPTTPPVSLQTPEPTPDSAKRPSRKGLKTFFIILLALIAVAGIGYSVYAWNQNKTLKSDVTSRDSQITALKSQVTALKTSSSAETTPSTITSGNVINIRELGLSITVPDSIKDITYSYKSGEGIESVSFSTKAITDKYSNTGSCSSSSSTAPLGTIDKFPGQYQTGNSTVALLKQFSTYFISYSTPQDACVDAQTSVASQLQAMKDSLASIKEL